MEQEAQTADWVREQGICQTHGGPRDDCDDSEREWFPQRRICYAAMIHAYAESKYDDLHKSAPFHDGTFAKWGKERTAETPFHFRDGVTLWVAESDLTPHDHFLGGARDCDECQEVDGGNTP